MSGTTTPRFVSVTAAAEVLGCSRALIYGKYVPAEDLHLVRHGRHVVVSLAELQRLADRLEEEAGVTPEAPGAGPTHISEGIGRLLASWSSEARERVLAVAREAEGSKP